MLQEQLDQNKLRLHRLEQAQVGDAVDLARRTSFGLESVQERLRGLYTLANQRLALLGSQAEPIDNGPSVTPQMLQDAAAEVSRLREGITAAEAGWVSRQAATADARGRLDCVDEEIAAQAVLVSGHDLEVSKLKGQTETAASRLAAVRGEVLRQQNALDAARGRGAAAQAQLDSLETEAAAVDAGETDLGGASELAQACVSEAAEDIERLREILHTHERERDGLAARTGALSLALEQKDGSSALMGAGLAGIRGLVAEHVRVHPGYEAAIAAALGSLADAVIADTRDAALDAITRARADDLGRVELIVADAGADAARPDLAGLPGVVCAHSVVTAPPGVLGLLARTVIADDLDRARSAAPALAAQGIASLTVITKAGDVLTEYVLRGGSGAKRSKLELVAERDTAAEKLGEVGSRIERVRCALAEQRGVLQAHTERSGTALAALRASDSRLAARAEKHNRFAVQVEASEGEFDRLSAAFEQANVAVADAENALARTATELATAQSRPRPILDVSTRDALDGELDAAREREVEARLQVETARERVRAGQARTVALSDQLDADRSAAAAAARRAVIRRRQVDAAAAVAETLPAVLASADTSVSQARLRLIAAEADRVTQNEELATLRREEGVVRVRLQGITENMHGLELQIYEKKLHLSGLLERAGGELGLVEDVLVAEYGPEQLIPDVDDPEGGGRPFDREEQRRRLAVADRKLAQLGRVNPLALEEFAALEQRHKFLTEQLTDLTNTRTDLLTIIEEIDGKMGAIFDGAFEDTQAAFAEVFPVLFPGGSGSIQLTDPGDMLTTGIEVSVKPAGKKIERLSLLSGGERSLAAVALLIAIFKARPSPFYIMDEVEAALDDANLGRLLTIFEDLREASQLIVITHQKRTMEIADALYGVSMRHDGVSAVVGQRIVKATEQAG